MSLFYSKILLFGEYSVIKNSMALSIPYNLFSGQLAFNQSKVGHDGELRSLGTYLRRLQDRGELGFDFDVDSFDFDIGQGLFFESTIPQGFGVGSSGALTAALFDRYAIKREENIASIYITRKNLASIESHFHGSSSGMDPLVSYINRPIVINENKELEIAEYPPYEKGKGGLFLLNTTRSRKTEPLVQLFLEKQKDTSFNHACEKYLIPITNSCIKSFLAGDTKKLQSTFRELSAFQYENFSPMIPNLFKDLWRQGLDDESFCLKLCGAGGGGFLLGITSDFKKLRTSLGHYEIRPILKFS